MNTINATDIIVDLNKLTADAKASAVKAQQDLLAKWTAQTGGNEYGEPMYCGFAWVTVYPEHKGNTRLGKQERATLESMGFRKDWTGKAWQLWNPTGYNNKLERRHTELCLFS